MFAWKKFAWKSFSENKQKVETENQKLRRKWKLEMKLVTLRAQVDVKLRAITAVSRNCEFCCKFTFTFR